jgi:hypothetical protein
MYYKQTRGTSTSRSGPAATGGPDVRAGSEVGKDGPHGAAQASRRASSLWGRQASRTGERLFVQAAGVPENLYF